MVGLRVLFGACAVSAVASLGSLGCSDTPATDGSGGAAGAGGRTGAGGSANFGGFGYDCGECECEPIDIGGYYFRATLDCFCCAYHCTPGFGPTGDGMIDVQTIIEYDCGLRLTREFQENPEIAFLIDTTTDEVVGASYSDDSGVCSVDGWSVTAGALDSSGVPLDCEQVSERVCDGLCGTGGHGGGGGMGGVGSIVAE